MEKPTVQKIQIKTYSVKEMAGLYEISQFGNHIKIDR